MAFMNRGWQQALMAALAVTSVCAVAAEVKQATATGQVRQVDAAAGKIAIKHGKIPELGLPAMTLVYHISPSLLKGIKPGDTVTFTAKRDNNQYVITKISK